jgi:hypothetical protein
MHKRLQGNKTTGKGPMQGIAVSFSLTILKAGNKAKRAENQDYTSSDDNNESA